MCSAFNSSTGHCALRPRPHFIRYRQAAACPRAAQKTQTYRSLRFPAVAALVPSAGTITLQIELRLDADALSTPHPVRTRAARVPTHRNAKIMEVLSILRGPSLTRLLQGAAAGAVVTMIVG